jgi:hypothetical protein
MLLAPQIERDLERKRFVHVRFSILPAIRRRDEAEAAVLGLGLQLSSETHGSVARLA